VLDSKDGAWWLGWGEVLAPWNDADAWQDWLTAALMRDAGIGEVIANRMCPRGPVRATVMARLLRAPFDELVSMVACAAATAETFELVRLTRSGSLWGVGVRLRMGYFTGSVFRAELVPELDRAMPVWAIEDAFSPLLVNERFDDRRKRVLMRLIVWNLAVAEASAWLEKIERGDEEARLIREYGEGTTGDDRGLSTTSRRAGPTPQ
jgi:hypothetical protein